MDEEKAGCLGEHCYRGRYGYGCCCGTGFLVFIIVFSISWDVLEPTEYGLLKNTLTGAVNLEQVYTNGRYFVGPNQQFLVFPRNRITLSFGNLSKDERRPMPARTGTEQGQGADSDSGGQPLDLSISFQYRLPREQIPLIYDTFGATYEDSYLRFAQQALTNVAQQFQPSSFWNNRAAIEAEMLKKVNNSLFQQGYANVERLQLRAISFQSTYEQTVIDIQLQEQLKRTKQYQQEVRAVEKSVDLLQSETTATIRRITAEGARESAVIVSEANAAALQLEQNVKGEMYAALRKHLGWTSWQFLQYIKQKALNAQPDNKVLVGVNAIGQVQAS